ncbi:hypothetical protein EWN99_21705 [Salmonella enterica]|nr:hypothetical protein [Salmonella enterica]EBS3177240.1 hypothetical protein [Salmonella enterica subsp. enterica serovar Newport]EBS3869399.1 hypothetical protein [Salmonella enterica subsp. enterica serovar Kimberley]EDL3630114.1 hypothetical protein [Salmonella enterica subsp. enterica serovar Newport]EEE9161457.1 hypothetical protein [Salmonella enterica subsp. enterica serovar Kimberley]
MSGGFSAFVARKSPLAFLITLMLLSSPAVNATGVTGYTSSDDLPEDAADLPAAPAERPWLHHRASRKDSAHKDTPLIPAALLPQLQALQTQMAELERARNQELTELKQQIADLTARQADGSATEAALKQQLVDREARVAELERRLADTHTDSSDLQQQLSAVKQQLARRDSQIEELKQQLTTEKNTHATQTAKILSLEKRLPDVPPVTPEQQEAYASGMAFAGVVSRSLRMQKELGINLPSELVLAGIADGLNHQPRLNSEQIKQRNQELDTRLNHLLAVRQEKEGELRAEQQKAGAEWYTRYRKTAGVKMLREGVLYRVLKAGKGAKIQAQSTADILLSGYLVDGKVFDDSGIKKRIQRVRPGDLLPALTDVLTTLNVGSHVEILLSPSQAFGDKGVPGLIPGGATLRFDIQISGIQDDGGRG